MMLKKNKISPSLIEKGLLLRKVHNPDIDFRLG